MLYWNVNSNSWVGTTRIHVVRERALPRCIVSKSKPLKSLLKPIFHLLKPVSSLLADEIRCKWSDCDPVAFIQLWNKNSFWKSLWIALTRGGDGLSWTNWNSLQPKAASPVEYVAKNQDIHHTITIQSYFYFRYINANENLLFIIHQYHFLSFSHHWELFHNQMEKEALRW